MKLYKLTDEHGCTRGGTQWGEGVTHSGTGEGELCGPGFIHAYLSPELAVLLNPIHANIKNPRLWECDGEIAQNDRNTKVGCVSLTTVREVPLPAVTTEQRVTFAIRCTLLVYRAPDFVAWAERWLSGEDRTRESAADAADAAYAAAWSVAWAEAATAAWSVAWAATEAATAAWAAASAADAAAAADAASAASAAARYAANQRFDLVALAREALQ